MTEKKESRKVESMYDLSAKIKIIGSPSDTEAINSALKELPSSAIDYVDPNVNTLPQQTIIQAECNSLSEIVLRAIGEVEITKVGVPEGSTRVAAYSNIGLRFKHGKHWYHIYLGKS